MSTRDKLRKLKSDVKSWVSSTPRVESVTGYPPPDQGSGTALLSDTSRRNIESSRVVDLNRKRSLKAVNPISRAAIEPTTEGSATTSETQASASPGKKSDGWTYLLWEDSSNALRLLRECEKLREELDAVFMELQEHCTRSVPPVTTATIEGLCRSIQNELNSIRDMQAGGKLRQYLEAGNNIDEIFECYRHIQSYFQRVALNVDLSIWRIVDEIATDNRLNRLSPALSACYNSAQAVGLKRGPCTPGTRVDLLSQMADWVDTSSPGSFYWMNSMAGTGKTTIAYSLCQELDASGRLAASFFCSRLLPECRDVSIIIPTIAYQLARFSHPFRFVLSGILEKTPDVHTRLPHLQFDALITQPLLLVKDTLPDNLVVVIDALDECEDKEITYCIIDILLTRPSILPLKFVLSSRPEPEILDGMVKQRDQANSRVVLHELDKEMEPTEDQIRALVERAGILFIYTATVVRYVGYDKFRRSPRTRLANVLSASNVTGNKHKEIDELYSAILHAAFDNPDLDDPDTDDMRQVLHAVICAQEIELN